VGWGLSSSKAFHSIINGGFCVCIRWKGWVAGLDALASHRARGVQGVGLLPPSLNTFMK
jgi:hypothetical protein